MIVLHSSFLAGSAQVYAPFLILFGCIVAGVALNRRSVFYRGKWLRPIFIVATCALVFGCVELLDRAGYAFSDSLAIAGLLITFLFGLGGSALLQHRARALVCTVITSRAPFNQELRKGLKQGLGRIPVDVRDDCAGPGAAYEDLTTYLEELEKVLPLRPDYVVAVPSSQEQSDSEQMSRVLSDLQKRGGRAIIIENCPMRLSDYAPTLTCINSDSEAGAKILANYAATLLRSGDEVVLWNGPRYSSAANIRGKIIEAELSAIEGISLFVGSLPGWSEDGCHQKTTTYLQHAKALPKIIICGNDIMALGAARAVQEIVSTGPERPKVFGYDGLFRALVAIANKDSPFFATVRIPPSSYGAAAAKIICNEIELGRRVSQIHLKIPIDAAHLFTKENSDKFLELF